MAQVTMDSKEYLELIDKARKLEKLEKEMIEAVEIDIEEDNRYSKYAINIQSVLTTNAQNGIIRKIIDKLVESDIVMETLAEENTHFLNVRTGYIYHRWNDEPEKNDVDLMKDKKFKEAFEAAEARLEVEAEEIMSKEEEE